MSNNKNQVSLNDKKQTRMVKVVERGPQLPQVSVPGEFPATGQEGVLTGAWQQGRRGCSLEPGILSAVKGWS